MLRETTAPSIEFDADLLARYDVAGPRYTSYPTAPSFRDDFGEEDYRAFARSSNEDPIPSPLSLYVHVPFCESPCFYCGCTRLITRDHGSAARYLDHLEREIALQAELFDWDRTAIQLHLGGGTPNFLSAAELKRLIEAIGRQFRLETGEKRDFSIEVDPRFAEAGLMDALTGLGFNRVSLGVQDFDPAVQRAINRVQPPDQTRAAVGAARVAGMRSVNLDLIYGLPKQTPASFERTVEAVLELRPDRIALYAYAHLPSRFKAQRQIAASDLPPPAEKLKLLGLAIEELTVAGYRYIGMDHFALPEDPLAQALDAGTLQRNFQGYSTHGECDLVGLGMSAISHVEGCYAQNARDLAGYYGRLDAGQLPIVKGIALDAEDYLRADLIQSVMCRSRLDFAAVESGYGITFAEHFAPELDHLHQLAEDGLVELDDHGLAVTPRGRPLLRVVAMAFDARSKGTHPFTEKMARRGASPSIANPA